MTLAIEETTFKKSAIVDLTGALVLGEPTAAFGITMEKLIGQYDQIIINMEGLRKLDCAGLGVLVHCEALARKKGTEIIIDGFSRHIGDVLMITRLVTLFPFGSRDYPKAA